MTKGIVYIVFLNQSGQLKSISEDHFFKELSVSIKSARESNPNLPITVISDSDTDFGADQNILVERKADLRRKMSLIELSPYNYTMYIDTDTKIVGCLQESFGLLDRFDVAMVADSTRRIKAHADIWPKYASIPNAFSEFCSGLIFYKKSDAFYELASNWKKNYEEWKTISKVHSDQQSFRVSLWETKNLNIHTLPIEYCIRTQDKLDSLNKRFPKSPIVYHWHSMYDSNLKRTPHKIHL